MNDVVSACPDDLVLAAFLDGELDDAELAAFHRHLDGCGSCRRVVGAAFDRNDSETVVAGSSTQSPKSDAFAPERGRTIGRYVILERIGSGGMGTVVRAYDPKLCREVALKALRSRNLKAEAESRLVREAQAMAQLRHPNVVAVYDVEVQPGHVVIAMEYVPGKTLGEWLETPRTWLEIADAFRRAGRGLAAAHAVGLVHRDFKPANVLVAEDGRVEVTDFGLAKLLTSPEQASLDARDRSVVEAPRDVDSAASSQPLETPLTHADMILGTPPYMAPEQHAGEAADARSDQYAFCVALWEALCGARPFEGRGEALVRAKVEGPPDWPRGIKVPTAIVQAIRRGLAPRAEDRWPDMNALLASLAYDPGLRRRRLLWAASLGTATIGIVVGAGAWTSQAPCSDSIDQLRDVWDETRRAELDEAIGAVDRPFAAATWSKVEARLDAYAQRWIAAHREACEDTVVHKTHSEAALDLRMACLSRARMQLRAAVDVLGRADAEVVERASFVLGGLPSPKHCRDVDALQSRAPPPADPETAHRVEHQREALASARSLLAAGKYAEARAIMDDVEAQLQDIDHAPLVAESAIVSGQVRSKHGEHDDAIAHYREALGVALKLRMYALAAEAAAKLAFALGIWRDALAEARWLADVALGLAEAHDPGGTLEMAARNALAVLLEREGQYALARAEHERIIAIAEKNLEPDDHALFRQRNNLALVLESLGELERAAEEYRRLIEARTDAVGSDHPDIASLRLNLSNVLNLQGHFAEAERECRSALALRRRLLGPDHPEVAGAHNNLANALDKLGRREEAEAEYLRAIAIYEEAAGEYGLRIAGIRGNLANIYLRQNRLAEAENEVLRAVAIVEDKLGGEHPQVAALRHKLGSIANRRGELEVAAGHYRQARDIWERALGPEHPHVATTSLGLARIAEQRGREAEAREELERAWAICERAEVPPAVRAESAWALARILEDDERAGRLANEALRAYEAAGDHHEASHHEVKAWIAKREPGTK